MGSKLLALLRRRQASAKSSNATPRGINPRTPAANIPQRKHELEKSASATTNLGPKIASSSKRIQHRDELSRSGAAGMGIAPSKPEERARVREPWVFRGGRDCTEEEHGELRVADVLRPRVGEGLVRGRRRRRARSRPRVGHVSLVRTLAVCLPTSQLKRDPVLSADYCLGTA